MLFHSIPTISKTVDTMRPLLLVQQGRVRRRIKKGCHIQRRLRRAVRVAGGAAVGLALLVRLVELVRLDAEVAGAGRHAEVRLYHAEYQRHLHLALIGGGGVSARAGETVRVAAFGG